MRQPKFIISILLIIVTVSAFWQLKDSDFVSFDDNVYVTENVPVQTGLALKNIFWAFSTTEAANWHPVTWLSHMLDCQLFRLNPRGHHATNLLFHVANTLLLFWLLAQVTGALWPSALVAALFAWHPLHVESVAWMAERKDVLSTFFWITTMWAYVWYVERPNLKRYLLVLCPFCLGLMAKPMLVTLPFVLLLMDYWPLGRFPLTRPPVNKGTSAEHHSPSAPGRRLALRLLLEKLPLLLLAILSCIITLEAQKPALATLEKIAFVSRSGNALIAYVTYLRKMIWPLDLAVFYPHPGNSLSWRLAAGAFLLLTGISYLAIRGARRIPYFLMGWLWYLGTLVPVIGLVQVGDQALADRYTYIPLIGIFIILAWGASDLAARMRLNKIFLGSVAALGLALCWILTWIQVGYWRDSGTLFEHAKNVTDNNYLAYGKMIDTYEKQGKIDEAFAMFQEAIKLRPDFALAYQYMGLAYDSVGRIDEAMIMFQKAIEINPNLSEAYNSLGIAYARQRELEEAVAMFQKAIHIKPHLVEAYNNLGKAYAVQGRIDEAIAMFQKAIQINPYFPGSYNHLGVYYADQGQLEKATAMFENAMQADPNYIESYNNLAIAYAEQGKIDNAIIILKKAITKQPDNLKAKEMLDSLMGAR